MLLQSLYFQIPSGQEALVASALLDLMPNDWACDGSWDLTDLIEDGYGVFCKFKRGSREHQARCHIATAPFVGAFGKEAGPQLPRVKLVWKGEYGGTRAHISRLEACCRALHLPEYAPQATPISP